jgi:predicted transcriptional regulator YdeE
MSAEITKVYKESHPALRFIGTRYTDADRDPVTGMFSPKWGEWHSENRFGLLEKHAAPDPTNGDAYIGLMGAGDAGFEYWIGMFFPENTPPLDGFDYADIPASEVGVCWIHGTEPDVYMQTMQCYAELLGEEMPVPQKEELGRWFEFERYNCPRFTTPDADGKIILDYGVYLKD